MMSESKLEELKRRIREHLFNEAKMMDDSTKLTVKEQAELGLYIFEVSFEVAQKHPNYKKGILAADDAIDIMKRAIGGAEAGKEAPCTAALIEYVRRVTEGKVTKVKNKQEEKQ